MDLVEEEYRLMSEHPSVIDPSTVSDECLAVRIARCSAVLQKHECNDACLVRIQTKEHCIRRGFDPTRQALATVPRGLRLELTKCKRNFPRFVPANNRPPRAHVVRDFSGIVRYNGPRDDGYVNACQPMFAHAWGANKSCTEKVCLWVS